MGGVAAVQVNHRTQVHSGSGGDINIRVVDASNGKVIQAAVHDNHGNCGKEITRIVPDGESIIDAIAIVLVGLKLEQK
jgi:hypothetical protein